MTPRHRRSQADRRRRYAPRRERLRRRHAGEPVTVSSSAEVLKLVFSEEALETQPRRRRWRGRHGNRRLLGRVSAALKATYGDGFKDMVHGEPSPLFLLIPKDPLSPLERKYSVEEAVHETIRILGVPRWRKGEPPRLILPTAPSPDCKVAYGIGAASDAELESAEAIPRDAEITTSVRVASSAEAPRKLGDR